MASKMKRSFAPSFRMRLLLLQALVVCATMVVAGFLVNQMQERQFREAYRDRMIAVAQSVATLPTILEAYKTEDPSAIIQPITEVVREASNVTYIVVTDSEGIRYSHTNPGRIGEKVSTDPSIPLTGGMYVGTQTGTLGESWRVKVPIFDRSDPSTIIGSVSVGILESDLRADLADERNVMFLSLLAAGVIGILGSTWLGYYLRRKTFKLEPEEIATLLETREAMISGIREGIVAVDLNSEIVLMNDAAKSLVGIRDDQEVIGRPIAEVLEPSLARLVETGSTAEQLVLSERRLLLARSDMAKLEDKIVGRLLILRDHTELHSLLNQLEGAQSLAQGLRAQAHEFLNQLHVISGLLELGRNEEAVAFIERVGAGGAITGLGQDDGTMNVEVAALLLSKRARAQELGVRVVVTEGSRLALETDGSIDSEVLTDVLTVLGNLIDNAVDAAPHNGTVWVELLDGDSIVLSVEDTGDGVPAELRETIFDVGVTTKSTDSSSRSTSRGIGLALVRRLVEKHHGSITVSQSVHGGARFTAELHPATALVPGGIT
jgi:two-component system CitB family sensor kinase